MRRIQRNLRDTAKNSNLFEGTVLDVTGSTATVRMSGAGAIYRNLNYVGGPLSVGDSVHVDFSTDTPMIKAPTSAPTYSAVEENLPFINLDTSGESEDVGIILEQSDLSREFYPVTYAGLLEAMGDANDWAKIIIPECSLIASSGSSFGEIPTKVKITGAGKDLTMLRGGITGGNNTFLENLTVWHHSTDVEETIAVIGPSSGNLTINDCFIRGLNCASSGSGYGIKLQEGAVYVYRSQISGESSGSGSHYGYAVCDDVGSAYIHDTAVYGDTDRYKVGSNIYVHGVYPGIALDICA